MVIDATTGQNGLNQAKEFNDALSLDGLIVTKLDGTAKGGIALAISNQLNLPMYRIGGRVRVKISGVNVARGQIDLALVE